VRAKRAHGVEHLLHAHAAHQKRRDRPIRDQGELIRSKAVFRQIIAHNQATQLFIAQHGAKGLVDVRGVRGLPDQFVELRDGIIGICGIRREGGERAADTPEGEDDADQKEDGDEHGDQTGCGQIQIDVALHGGQAGKVFVIGNGAHINPATAGHLRIEAKHGL